MRLLLIAGMFLLSSSTWAQSPDPRIKSWKTLVNDNGFEFKYPDCWTVRPDDPDEMGKLVTEARSIVVEETKSCGRPLLNPPRPNLVGFNGGTSSTTREESLKKIGAKERNSKSNLARKVWAYFTRLKLGSDDAVVYVRLQKHPSSTEMHWVLELYCPTYLVSYSGPSVKDPDQSYFEKFKSGDMALPEPEKTIFESIRCIEPKKK